MAKESTVAKSIAKRMLSINEEVLLTSDYIANQYGTGVLGVKEMADILKIKENSVKQKISSHTMPFKVTKIGDQWYTTPYSVAQYLVSHQQDRSLSLEAG